MFRRFLLPLLLVISFAAGIGLTWWYFQGMKVKKEEQATILLEKIKNVSKLITVEGYLTEIYDYKEYYGYDWSPFRKKALLRVKAKVSVGVDLGNMDIALNQENKTVTISGIPAPSILSIDHQVDYYDLQEGTFNNFTSDDITRLNTNAKNFIRAKAEESELMNAAGEQTRKVIDMLRFLVETDGWRLEVKEDGRWKMEDGRWKMEDEG